MTADDKHRAGFSLRRWSRRKLEAARAAPAATPAPSLAKPIDSPASSSAALAAQAPSATHATAPATPALPPVDSLTFDSDFTAFLQPEVEEAVKRTALRKLFRDPRFNVMDGLDTYIDDYSIPDPISPEMVRQLVQSRYIFDPPQTRINAAGIVEDVPPEERTAVTGAEAPAAATNAAAAPALPASPDADPQKAVPPSDAMDAAPDATRAEPARTTTASRNDR